jgi:hypothetical protein
MRLRALVSVISAVLTPLILTGCHRDITAPSPTLVWSSVASPTNSSLVAVWGSSASDVWAVGNLEPQGGAMVHYDGTSWSSVMSAIFTDGSVTFLNAVWGSSASDVWAVGCCGTVLLHYNGTTWSNLTGSSSQRLHGVWGTSASNVWAVGDGGTILHYDGTSWSAVQSGIPDDIWGVWGSSATNVWAVAIGGGILHYDGTSWLAVFGGTNPGLFSVWGTSAFDVWAVGTGLPGQSGAGRTTILHYTGGAWGAWSPSVAPVTLAGASGVWGTSPQNMWVVGDGVGSPFSIAHYDGTSWQNVPGGSTQFMHGVWGSSASDVWAVGFGGTILHGTPAR